MKYAEITFRDKNFVKRFLQRKRLKVACNEVFKLLDNNHREVRVLDYGCGNAELYKLLGSYGFKIFYEGFDPLEEMISEATANIGGKNNILLTSSKADLSMNSYDIIFCLEVFEHLPDFVLNRELVNLNQLLTDNGIVVFGVPNEIYLAGFIRGIFRMSRRFGAFDATPKNIALSTLGRPPKNRNVNMNADGTYLHYHMGFDHRQFLKKINSVFKVKRVFGSPLPLLTTFLNTEITILAYKFKVNAPI